MNIFGKLKNILTSKVNPDLLDTWEITEILNPAKFMGFILENTPVGSTWCIDSTALHSKVKLLNQYGLRDNKIILNEQNIKEIISVLPELEVNTSIVEHCIITPTKNKLLVTYDNLTCVWVSKVINEETIKKASSECLFKYEDISKYVIKTT